MKKWGYGITAFIIILVVFYALDYRVGTFGVGRLGHLEMTIPLTNTDIFVDDEKKITTTGENEKVSIALSPTNHQTIVSRGGYLPWTKKFEIPSGSTVTLAPIFVTSNATGMIITARDPEYARIRNAVTRNALPVKENPRLSADGTTELWVEANTILVRRDGAIFTVLAPEPIITSVEFYKERSDVVLFSAGTGIFAIETDTNAEHIQNILPVFTGQTPRFAPNDDGSMYVLDGTLLMAVVI